MVDESFADREGDDTRNKDFCRYVKIWITAGRQVTRDMKWKRGRVKAKNTDDVRCVEYYYKSPDRILTGSQK